METDGGGWTVFQRRMDGTVNFYRGWSDYLSGFGDLDGEFWLGLNKIHHLTSVNTTLRVDLHDFSGNKRYAKYSIFDVGDSDTMYKLLVGGYSGDAGDSLQGHNGFKFTTKDRDNDIYNNGNCAVHYKGGWWYTKCHSSNLNGLYLSGNHTSYADGVNWYYWKKFYYSLSFTEMKVKRKK